MTQLKFFFFGLMICMLAVGCSHTTSVNKTDDQLFLEENTVEGYTLLVDFGQTGHPYDFSFPPSGWQIYTYHPVNNPNSTAQTALDTVTYHTENSSGQLLIPSIPASKSANVYQIHESYGYLYINARSISAAEKKSSLFLFDTLTSHDPFTSHVDLLFCDSLLGLTCTGSDMIFFFYTAENGNIYRYDMSCRSLGLSYSTPRCLMDSLHYFNGNLISIDSSSICKTDTLAHSTLWKTNFNNQASSSVHLNDVIFHDGYIYAIGFETTCIGQVTSCGDRAFAAKLDFTGNILWQNTYANNGGHLQDNFQKLAFSPTGDLLCFGTTGSKTGGSYFYLSRIGQDGIQKAHKILSEFPAKQSTMRITITNIEKVEDAIVHMIFTGSSNGKVQNYYAQISF